MKTKTKKNEKLSKDAKAARDAGMTYGQYTAAEYLSKQPVKERPAGRPAARGKKTPKKDGVQQALQKEVEDLQKEVEEQSIMLSQADKIQIACEEAGIGSLLTWYSETVKPGTYAAKLAKNATELKRFPTKTSFMYCEGLDMCFFYNGDGKACLSYSGFTAAGSKDISGGVVKAFEIAEKILSKMQQLADEDKHSKGDQINLQNFVPYTPKGKERQHG